ncbi:multidrug efflux MFS transporter [Rubrobacter marinus]|nr:multidrug efflux MFS transporter [Rubrobacter marinus]
MGGPPEHGDGRDDGDGGPALGRLADKFGHKPMLLRATLAGAVVVGSWGS